MCSAKGRDGIGQSAAPQKRHTYPRPAMRSARDGIDDTRRQRGHVRPSLRPRAAAIGRDGELDSPTKMPPLERIRGIQAGGGISFWRCLLIEEPRRRGGALLPELDELNLIACVRVPGPGLGQPLLE